MNNNIKFDPMTGEPIKNIEDEINENNNINNVVIQPMEQQNINEPNNNQTVEEYNEQEPIIPIDDPIQPEITNDQIKLQDIPTVGQNQQDFINKVQATNQEKNEEKKEKINFTFIIILFVIMLVAIYFLFPLLAKYI